MPAGTEKKNRSAGDARPNILWYCTDQQRWDTIAALGNPHIRTTNIDRLVASGTAFRRCYSQSPVCTPSRASFLTGRYPASHHIHRNGAARFPSDEVLVTKIFADAGYDCGLVGKLHLTAGDKSEGEMRFNDGYRVFHWNIHPRPDHPATSAYSDWLRHEKKVDPLELFADSPNFYGPGVPAEYHQTTWCTEMAIRFIGEKRQAPWLLSVNVYDPHPPFDPPADYLKRYDPATLPPPLYRQSDPAHQQAFREVAMQTPDALDVTGLPLTPDRNALRQTTPGGTTGKPPASFDARYNKAAYYAMIELIDEEFGRLVNAIRDMGQLDNTLIIFTSDHGELLGDHGLIFKGCRFFEGLVRVPMILSWPAGGVQVLQSNALVELVDIAPTLLEAAGIDIPARMQGRSFLDIMRGTTDPDHHKDHVVSEFNDAMGTQLPSHGFMYCDGHYKICVYDGIAIGELYDLEADPGEFDNLWNDPTHVALKTELLHRQIQALLATSDAGVERIANY